MKKEDLRNLLIVLEIAIIFVLIAFLIAKPVVKGWEKSQNISHSYSKTDVLGKNKPKKGTKNDIPEDIKRRLDRPNPSIPDTRRLNKPNRSEHAARRVSVPTNQNCPIYLNGHCFSRPKYAELITYEQCVKNKNKLGVAADKCSDAGNRNHWMSAVYYCGGVNKLPSDKDLDALASDLYGIPMSEFNYDHSNGYTIGGNVYQLDKDRAYNNMGFKPFYDDIGEHFKVWSGEDGESKKYAHMRYFYKFSTISTNLEVTYPFIHSICRID